MIVEIADDFHGLALSMECGSAHLRKPRLSTHASASVNGQLETGRLESREETFERRYYFRAGKTSTVMVEDRRHLRDLPTRGGDALNLPGHVAMETARRQNRCELVAEGIKQLILDEGLKQHDRLPTEHQLAVRFGVSRVTVREATKALGFLGILRAAPRRGLTVGDVDMSRVAEYLGFHLALNDYPKKQLWRTRFIMETGALPYVAQAMAEDGALFGKLRAIIEAARHSTDVERRVQSDIEFHRTLVEISGIGPLVAFNELLQIFFTRLRNPDPPRTQWNKTVKQHTRLIEYLRGGDLEGARRTLHAHFSEYPSRLDEPF
jgi:GntR family transcriptional repressor for pyruvate dehydrogenase complex